MLAGGKTSRCPLNGVILKTYYAPVGTQPLDAAGLLYILGLMDVFSMVQRLVATHGEEGICPSAADWQAILELPEQPFAILNLLKFRKHVEVDGRELAGAAAYRQYSAAVASAFQRHGGTRLFIGRVAHFFPQDLDDWDLAVLARYPNPIALAQMWLDGDFISAHRHRLTGVERSGVLLLEG